MIDDPHLGEVAFFASIAQPTEGMLKVPRPAPNLGEDTRTMLEVYGCDRGVIGVVIARWG